MIPSRTGICLLLAALAFQGGMLHSSPSSKPSPQRKEKLQAPSPASLDRWQKDVRRLLEAKKPGEARALCDRTLKLAKESGDVKWEAQAHHGLGLVSWARGDLQGALTSFEKSLSLWRSPGVNEPVQEANTLVQMGEVLLAVGQSNEAIATFNEARKLLRSEDPPRLRFAVVSGTGMAHLDMGDWQKAIFFYRLALGIAQRSNDSEDKAVALHRLGTLYTIQGDWSEAQAVLKKSREFARRAKKVQIEAYAIAELAHLADLAGREKEALRGFEEARKVFEGFGNGLYISSTLLGTAEVERDLGQIEKAISSIERSIELVEPLRSNLEEPGDRVGFFAARHRYHDFYVELLMEQARRKPGAGYGVRAFEAGERSKARSQLDDMAGESGPATQGMSLPDIQTQLLDQDSVLLAYTLGTRGSFLWVVRLNGISVFKLPPRAEVEEEALQAWRGLSQGKGSREVKKLSRTLLPDAIGPLAGKRILVSPDGLLHLIPFSLLKKNGDRMLLLDHEIVHLPSASVVVGMRRKLASRQPSPMKFAGLGDPVFRIDDKRLGGLGEPTGAGGRGVEEVIRKLPFLDYADDEIESIFSLFPEGQRFKALAFEANRKTAIDMMPRFQILHFASHHLAGGHPTFTGLVLSRFDERGRLQRGFLTAPEIYKLNLPAELVVLSACGTGLGQDVWGEGPVGLTRAFLHAGAKRVVVSLWSVKDKATAELMRRFYLQMRDNNLAPAAALRAAQISMFNDSDWRLYSSSWGAFVLQGEPR